ncbi:MAG: FHA domain-containing protein [Planctomycetota bacterium]
MTLRLFVLSGSGLGHSQSFESLEVTIGRAPECDLVLGDRAVSRAHARLRRVGGGAIELRDLDSTSGTFVGGERVMRCLLSDGDEFRLGDVELRLRVEGAVAGAAEEGPGIELEGDWEEVAARPTAVPRSAPTAPEPAPVAAAPGPRGTTRVSAARAAAPKAPTPAGKAPLQYSPNRGASGPADLAQRPVWVRLVVGFVACGLFCALLYGSYFLVQKVKGARQDSVAPVADDGAEDPR